MQADRLQRWHRPGLLCIGDAAHAMSPVGGIGINLAIADAVAAANILARPLRKGGYVRATWRRCNPDVSYRPVIYRPFSPVQRRFLAPRTRRGAFDPRACQGAPEPGPREKPSCPHHRVRHLARARKAQGAGGMNRRWIGCERGWYTTTCALLRTFSSSSIFDYKLAPFPVPKSGKTLERARGVTRERNTV